MVISVVIGSLIVPFQGKLLDRYNPQIIIPSVFAFRLVSIIMFLFVQDPSSWYSYVSAVLMVMGTMCELVSCDSITLRLADKEIRGVLYGVQNMFGFVGLFLFTLAGGFMFDYIGPKSPFVMVGAFDLIFAISTIILGLKLGYLKNDVAERKRKEYEAKEALLALERENENIGDDNDNKGPDNEV